MGRGGIADFISDVYNKLLDVIGFIITAKRNIWS